MPPAESITSHTATQRHYHPHMTISGRLSAQFEQNNKPQSIHIQFTWVQTPQQTTVTLTSPTGQTLASLLMNEEGASLIQSNKPTRYALDANTLMFSVLGWPLPIGGLQDWLQGFTEPTHQSPITSASSETLFEVDGWSIQYRAWAAESKENQAERPKRIDLMRQTQEAGFVTLRIVIDQWNESC